MKSGVYKILNLLTGDRYIGSSIDVPKRFTFHRIQLKNGKHINKHLQRAYNKYGANVFCYGIIEYCTEEEMIPIEQKYIDLYDFDKLYNNRKIAESNTGYKHTKQFSLDRRNYRHTAKAKESMSKTRTGKKLPAFTQSHLEKIRKSRLGKKASGQAKINMSIAQTGLKKKPHTEETKKKISESRKGKGSWVKGTRNLGVSSTIFKKGIVAWNKGVPYPQINKTFQVVSPNMVLYLVNGQVSFCSEIGCNYKDFGAMLNGKKERMKGWRLPKEDDVYKEIIEWKAVVT